MYDIILKFNYYSINYNYICIYWVVRKVRAAKDLNLINEIKNLNLLRFNFLSKSARTFKISTNPKIILIVKI